MLLSFNETDDRNSLPSQLALIIVGTDLHDSAVFGAFYDLAVVEGILLVGYNQDHWVCIVDGAGVLHSLLGLSKCGVIEDYLNNLEVFSFRERYGGVKHSDAIGQPCLLLRFCVTFPALLCRVGSDCEEAKRKEYTGYDAKKV